MNGNQTKSTYDQNQRQDKAKRPTPAPSLIWKIFFAGSRRSYAVYARDLRKWLIIAPIIGLITGLVITGSRGDHSRKIVASGT